MIYTKTKYFLKYGVFFLFLTSIFLSQITFSLECNLPPQFVSFECTYNENTRHGDEICISNKYNECRDYLVISNSEDIEIFDDLESSAYYELINYENENYVYAHFFRTKTTPKKLYKRDIYYSRISFKPLENNADYAKILDELCIEDVDSLYKSLLKKRENNENYLYHRIILYSKDRENALIHRLNNITSCNSYYEYEVIGDWLVLKNSRRSYCHSENPCYDINSKIHTPEFLLYLLFNPSFNSLYHIILNIYFFIFLISIFFFIKYRTTFIKPNYLNTFIIIFCFILVIRDFYQFVSDPWGGKYFSIIDWVFYSFFGYLTGSIFYRSLHFIKGILKDSRK